jgi:glycosyltransferase involved in cell wall biosynthesis
MAGVSMGKLRVLFATDSELGHFGLGGPSSHIARALVREFPTSHIFARKAGNSGIPPEFLTLMKTPSWISVLARFRRLQWLLPSQAWDRIQFDRWSASNFREAGIVVGENTTSLATLREAEASRARRVLMYYNRSFRLLLEDAEEERRRWGGPRTFLNDELVGRAEEECRRAERIVCMSRLVSNDLQATGVPPGKLRRAHYGVDLERFRPVPTRPGEFIVAFVGWLAPWKGYPYLVEAFRDAAIPGSRLLLHGGTSVPFHHRLVDRLKGGADVRVVHGPVEETYARASVLVLPSVSDAYGLVALEAMASGIPVVVTDRCGAAEDVRDGVNGFVVPARDSAALRSRIVELHGDAGLRERMGREGRRTASALTWERFSREVLDVLRELESAA